MGRRGVNFSFKWLLPVFDTYRGRGEGIRAVCAGPTFYILQTVETTFLILIDPNICEKKTRIFRESLKFFLCGGCCECDALDIWTRYYFYHILNCRMILQTPTSSCKKYRRTWRRKTGSKGREPFTLWAGGGGWVKIAKKAWASFNILPVRKDLFKKMNEVVW